MCDGQERKAAAQFASWSELSVSTQLYLVHSDIHVFLPRSQESPSLPL